MDMTTAPAKAAASHREFLAQRVQRVKPSGIRRFFDIAATMKDVISLGVGEPDFTTPRHICEAAIASINAGETHYTSNYGTVALREAIAQELATRYGLTYDPADEIMATVGVSEALDDALRAVVDIGDEVLVPDPGYVAYEAGIILAGGVVIPVPTSAANGFEPMAADFANRITSRTKAILIGSPNNPTGAVISRTQLEAIAQIAQEHDLVVISDEIYSRLVYGAEHHSIAALPGMWERTITLNGFSKAYAMTGWRIGYAAAPPHILEAMLKVHQYAIMCAPTDAQAAALEALRHGEADVQAMVAEYQRRRLLMMAGFNRMGLPCHEPHGAFYVFPDITSTGLTADEFTEKLLSEEHVAVVPGDAFGAAGAGYVRCAYATAYEKLEEALTRIERFVARQRG
jgi:aminotransferase